MTTLMDALATKPHLLAVESFDGKSFFIKAVSALTGTVSQMVLETSESQLYAWAVQRVNIQEAMPQLNPDEREFLMTGIRSDEWDASSEEDE